MKIIKKILLKTKRVWQWVIDVSEQASIDRSYSVKRNVPADVEVKASFSG